MKREWVASNDFIGSNERGTDEGTAVCRGIFQAPLNGDTHIMFNDFLDLLTSLINHRRLFKGIP